MGKAREELGTHSSTKASVCAVHSMAFAAQEFKGTLACGVHASLNVTPCMLLGGQVTGAMIVGYRLRSGSAY